MFQLVVFDIAGTTLKDNNNVNDCFRKAFEAFSFYPTKDQVNAVMGWRKPDAISAILSEISIVNSPKIQDKMKEEYLKHMTKDIHDQFVKLMIDYYQNSSEVGEIEGTSETFNKLHSLDIKVALDTGFSRDITNAILKNTQWVDNGLVDFTITADEVLNGRPAPDMINAIASHFNLNTSSFIKVGDTPSDIQEGLNANCGAVIAVCSGAYTQEQFNKESGNFHILDSIIQVPDFLQHSDNPSAFWQNA